MSIVYSTVTSVNNGWMQLVWPDVDAVLATATSILRAGTLITALTVSKPVEGKHLYCSAGILILDN